MQWAITAKVETLKYVKRKLRPSVSADGVRAPFLEPAGEAFLHASLREAACFVEYGSGGSTVFALSLGVPSVVSVESDPAFLAVIESEVSALGALPRWRGLLADIGPTRKWGYPAAAPSAAMGLAYAQRPWPIDGADVVLIDGRFRAACCLAVALACAPGTLLLFDDYAGRDYYRVVETVLGSPSFEDSMAVFRVPSSLDDAAASALLARVASDAR